MYLINFFKKLFNVKSFRLESLIWISPAFVKICSCKVNSLISILDSIDVYERNNHELKILFEKIELCIVH